MGHWRKIMRKLVLTRSKAKVMRKVENIKFGPKRSRLKLYNCCNLFLIFFNQNTVIVKFTPCKKIFVLQKIVNYTIFTFVPSMYYPKCLFYCKSYERIANKNRTFCLI